MPSKFLALRKQVKKGLPKGVGKGPSQIFRPAQVLRWGVVAATVCVLTYLMGHRKATEFGDLREGTVARERIVTPFTFWVKKSPSVFEREQANARRRIPPLLVFSSAVGGAQVDSLDTLFKDLLGRSGSSLADSLLGDGFNREGNLRAISDPAFRILIGADPIEGQGYISEEQLKEIKNLAYRILTDLYTGGIVSDKQAFEGKKATWVTMRKDEEENLASSSHFYDTGEISDKVLPDLIQERWAEAHPALARALYELIQAFISPNLTFDSAETERRREVAAQSVSQNRNVVLENQKIIDAHERVTSEHVDILRSLSEAKYLRHRESPYAGYLQILASFLLSSLVLGLILLYLYAFRNELYRRTEILVLFGILLIIPTLVASYLSGTADVSSLYVPVALSAMLVALLLDIELGITVAVMSAILCGVALNDLHATIVSSLCGMVGCYSVRRVRNRQHFNYSIIYLTISYVLVILVIKGIWFTYSSSSDIFGPLARDLIPGLVMGILTPVLTLGLSPMFENLFGIVTPITLLELSDLNRPLLRNLATRAPGSYSHSVIVANLSETAAEAIDANALLARVGCYYHDIGKMVRPQYFVENQSGENPHDELQPRMSALVLISHVREGIRMAEQEGLPKIIIDIIPQHQGTGEIAYFKNRALERGEEIRDEDFRYPGPKPQTKEAGIIMLADSVESAVRSLKERTPSRVKGMVRSIIEGKFTSGELNECALTLGDLHKIEQAFLPVLRGMMHTRVAYPSQRQKESPRV